MNKLAKIPVCRLLLLLSVAVMMSACVNTLELAVPRGGERAGVAHEVSVANAREYFYSHFGSSTRSEEQQPTPEAPYVVGNLVPDWESGVSVSNEEKSYTDFEMRKDSRFFLALKDEEDRLCGFELYSRLASVDDFGLDTLNQYVATYIPDISFLSCYESFRKDNLLTCEYVDWFTGVMLYTDLYGHHIAAYKYYDGQLTDSSFLYDGQKTPEENVADFMRVMGGISLFIAPAEDETRAVATVDIPGGTYICCYDETTGKVIWEYYNIDTISIVNTNHTFYDPFALSGGGASTSIDSGVGTTIARPDIPSGGGGGSTTTTEEEEPTGEEMAEDLFDTSELSELEKATVENMLEEIYDDCMGKALLTSLLLTDTKMSIVFNYEENAGFSYSDGIRLNNNHSEALLHELFHAYQLAQVTSTVFYASVANYEVEAYLATYYYMTRSDNPEVVQRSKNFNRRRLGSRAPILHKMLNEQANPNSDTDLTKFMTIYINEARVIKSDYDRKHKELGDDKVMGINKEETFEESVKNIQSISGECNVNKK